MSRLVRVALGGLAGIALLAQAAPAGAQPLASLFAEATNAAARGDHETAIAAYDRLVEAGVTDPDVFFDRATVHAREGRFGRAIRDFRAALELRPGDEGSEAGLRTAREALAQRRAERDGEASVGSGGSPLHALVRPWSEAALAWLVLVLDLAFFVALAGAMLARREVRTVAFGVAAGLFGLALVASGAALAVRRGVFRDGPPAVVLEDGGVLEGPVDGARARGRADEGSDATVLGRAGGYVKVRVGDQTGWMKAERIGLVGS